VAAVDKSDPKKYGEFLVAVGGCGECHTPTDDKGQPIPGKLLAGGRLFDTPMGKVVSANITPDIDTGTGKWSQEFFLKKFYSGRRSVFFTRRTLPLTYTFKPG
jgi:hypothetical protein